MRIDLHMHTHLSDGAYAPEDVLKKITAAKLDVVAISDHDTNALYREHGDLLQALPFKIIPAAEFSVEFAGRELHILAYFPKGFPEAMQEYINIGLRDREDRIRTLLDNLHKQHEILITFDAVRTMAKGPSLGRTHVAAVMRQRGLVNTLYDAFRKYLDFSFGLTPPVKRGLRSTLDAIQQFGGISVWAHPEEEYFDEYLESMVSWGLQGIEVHNGARKQLYSRHRERMADYFQLLKTGGSDWHGWGRRELGEFSMQEKQCEQFLERVL